MTDPIGTSRRDFLKTGAAASGALAAGLGFVPSVHARGNDVIKVGLIGCGGRGTGAAENICEAAGTSYNVKIHALADVFPERVKNCRENLAGKDVCKEKLDLTDDRCFVGFDAFQKVIDCCDLVMLATPPGFRPQHLEAAVKAGKQIFTEKPVSVDGPGTRKVLAAYEEAKKKNLNIVAGTQRRHQAGYIESLKRIRDGALGDLVTARVFWNQGNIWANKRQPGWSDMEYQIRNWYHFTWLCGGNHVEQHVHNLDVALWALGAPPVSCVGMGGRQVNTAPEYGQSFDHYAVDYEFPNGIHVLSMSRQINGCANDVSEYLAGTRGRAHLAPGQYRFEGTDAPRIRGRGEVNPYVQEHIDLLEAIASGKTINELKQVAESTLTAIMGRMSAFTGKAVSWDQALNSKLDTFPEKLEWGPLPEGAIPVPGQTELV
jgi:myo-inositol 2-dehydrogenase/D-chiro-inositol 1-dehydrogenase